VGCVKDSEVEKSCERVVRPWREAKDAERRRKASGCVSMGAVVVGGRRECVRRRSSVGSFIVLICVD
jgi:hypothetical protein